MLEVDVSTSPPDYTGSRPGTLHPDVSLIADFASYQETILYSKPADLLSMYALASHEPATLHLV
jgi:hypothetical protein